MAKNEIIRIEHDSPNTSKSSQTMFMVDQSTTTKDFMNSFLSPTCMNGNQTFDKM